MLPVQMARSTALQAKKSHPKVATMSKSFFE